MEKKDYYRQLVALYEAVITEEEPAPEALPQNDPYGEPEAAPVDPANPADMQEGPQTEDAQYTGDDGMAPELSPEVEPAEVSDTMKLKKLFDLFNTLLNYGKTLLTSLEDTIDLGLFDEEKLGAFNKIKDRLRRFDEKTTTYISEVFSTEAYERALYVYILLRTELVTIIKLMRVKLELDTVDEDKPKK